MFGCCNFDLDKFGNKNNLLFCRHIVDIVLIILKKSSRGTTLLHHLRTSYHLARG